MSFLAPRLPAAGVGISPLRVLRAAASLSAPRWAVPYGHARLSTVSVASLSPSAESFLSSSARHGWRFGRERTRMGGRWGGALKVAVVGLGAPALMGASAWWKGSVDCMASNMSPPPGSPKADPTSLGGGEGLPTTGDEPKSIVSIYDLSFGTVCGVCAGVFVKKGLKALAFLLGGAFVLLQYLASKKYVQINWSAIGSRYNSFLDAAAGPADAPSSASEGAKVAGHGNPPLVRIWNRAIHFLTADFQSRASFLAGFVLGLRLG